MKKHQRSNLRFRRSALCVALGVCFAGGVQAQSTTGSIHGSVPPGTAVVISNNSGISRTIIADANGRYTASQLPVGDYTVTAGGAKRQVVVIVGSAADVSFGDSTNTLGAIIVRASKIPPIDVTATDTRTIITAAELKRLPIARSAESIALLAPGAVGGNGSFFANQITFGGSSVAENAYYLNGYFSGNPITNIGGFTLPFGSIEQQETYTGGYGAKYGRSAGGVISQVGKSGSNDWHFGGQIVYTPRGLKSERPDRFFPNIDFSGPNSNPNLPYTCGDSGTERCQYSYTDSTLPGTAYDSGKGRLSWDTVYSGYVSGPIFKDHLFFFLSAEDTRGNTDVPGGNPEAGFAATGNKYTSRDPKLYAKLNWNINDSNLLEFTYVAEKYKEKGTQYAFDWNTYSFGAELNPATATKSNTEFSILRYTGYLTDNLTLTANYGRSRNRFDTNPFLTGHPVILSSQVENPALNGGTPNTGVQADYRATKGTREYTDGLRVELEWLWRNHTFNFGVDNTKLDGVNQGTSQVADAYVYGKAGDASTNVAGFLGVGPTGTVTGACDPATGKCGYNVYRLRYFDTTSMSNKQNAFYVEDKWKIADRVLLSLGVRADTYQNFSDTGQKFVDSGTQWQPRIGFAWDVNGDSSFKVFGNAGRYFLNLPNAVAIRGVGASTFTREYFTYTGIADDGTPTGLTPINRIGTNIPAGPVSSNGELGQPKDPLTYVPEDLKSQYQDEFVLGFEHSLGESWNMGAKLTARVLKSAVDDVCDPYTLLAKAGLEIQTYDYSRAAFVASNSAGKLYTASYCYIFNPGGSNTYAFQEVTKNVGSPGYTNVPGSYDRVKVSSNDLGFGPLRRYYTALDLFVERKWDGKWEGRIDYTLSKSVGNSEGPANSDTGQGSNPHDNGVGTSQNFDAYQINAFSDGYLPNHRRHQLKAHGAYAITPDLLVSANVRIASGAPISCFGYYDPTGATNHGDPQADPIGYGDSYHTCFGQPFPPGKKTTPWSHRLDVGFVYKPGFLDHKLAFSVNVFNVLNERRATSYVQGSEDDGPYSVNNDYNLPQSFATPRYVQAGVSYEF